MSRLLHMCLHTTHQADHLHTCFLCCTQELKDELQSRGLDTAGLKAVLVERLEEAITAEEAGGTANGTAAAPADTAAEEAAPAEAGSGEAGGDAAAKPAEEVGHANSVLQGYPPSSAGNSTPTHLEFCKRAASLICRQAAPQRQSQPQWRQHRSSRRLRPSMPQH